METTIHIGGRKHIKPSSVIFLTADQNYTKLILDNGEHFFVATTLKKLQARLQASGDFFRPNRGNLLNMSYMATYTETSITMANNQTFKITRRRQSAFLSMINSNA